MKHQLIIRATSVGAIMAENSKTSITEIQLNELNELLERPKYSDSQSKKIDEFIIIRDFPNEIMENGKPRKPITEKQLDELNKLLDKPHYTQPQLDKIADLTAKRDAKPELSETGKKEIQKIVLFDKYGIEKDFSTKQMEKGIQNEPISIEMASEVLGWFDVTENKKRLFNEWVCGEPDVLTPSLLADVKSSWDGLTFPWFKDENPTKAYFYQMQTYMWLTGRNECELVFVLTDTPEQMLIDMIQREIWRSLGNPKFAEMSQSEIETMIESRIREINTYSQIPIEKRVKQYIIKKDDAVIEKIKKRVEMAREYYDLIFEQI